MSVYSQPFLTVANITSSLGAQYSAVVPANSVAIVRDISGTGNVVGSDEAVCFVQDPSSHNYKFAWFQDLGQSGAVFPFHWEGRVALEPGWRIGLGVDGGACDFVISGYLLSNY